MRWDAMLVFFVLIIFTMLDANKEKAMQKEIDGLKTRVAKLEPKPKSNTPEGGRDFDWYWHESPNADNVNYSGPPGRWVKGPKRK